MRGWGDVDGKWGADVRLGGIRKEKKVEEEVGGKKEGVRFLGWTQLSRAIALRNEGLEEIQGMRMQESRGGEGKRGKIEISQI